VVSGPAGICIYLAWNDYRTLLAQQKSRKDEKDTGGKTGSGNSNKVL
jgi:hypothetical protein